MRLPFSVEQFFNLFGEYNAAVWPAQVMLIALAVAAVALVVFPRGGSGLSVALILAFLWGWLAVAYHLLFFTRINPLAYLFSGVSLAGACLCAWEGAVRRRLRFKWTGGLRAFLGGLLIVYALLVYPLWSVAAGHRYPAAPTFGLPCPTTIFTVGVLAFAASPYPRSVFIVPVLWCAVGLQAAFLLGVTQDFGLGVAGVIGLFLAGRARPKTARF
jgi:hypothetical protein